jgi:hypothetical protein
MYVAVIGMAINNADSMNMQVAESPWSDAVPAALLRMPARRRRSQMEIGDCRSFFR